MRAPALPLALLVLTISHTDLHAQVRDPWHEDGMANMASTVIPPATVAAIALSIRSRAIQDSRCYLMNGGAVESFFISEDSPVGSVIGTLSVNGDPDEERGDITLSVQERGAAVAVARGTKNVTLRRALDREQRAGPASVYVNVRCERRRTPDPSFVIPVSVRVWDVNDNAPQWVGAPYRVRLSELAAPGSRLLPAARASDADQPGPHATVRYRVLPGPHSEYFSFPNELESALILSRPLDYETLPNFTVTLRAEDGGSPPLHNDTTLQVTVLDADDQNPAFSHEHYSATLTDDLREGSVLSTSPGPVSAADQDVGINAPLHYSATGDNKHLVAVDRDTGRVAATDQLLSLTQPATIVLKAVQVDNPDRYALATLSVSPRGSPLAAPVHFARDTYSARVSEAAPPGTVVLTLHTLPAAPRDTSGLQFYVSDRGFLEKFAIDSAGEVVLRRSLDYEDRDQYHYQVMVTDGQANDTASLNITVENVNEWEPRFRYPQYEFHVGPEGPGGAAEGGAAEGLLPVGTLDVFDGDRADTVAVTLRGGDAHMLYVSPGGAVFLRRAALAALNTSVLHVLATATDSGAPPRQTSVPVTVRVSPRLLAPPRGAPLLAWGGAALALLALLLCALLLYVCRRRSKSTPRSTGAPYMSHEKTRPASPPAPPPPAALPALVSGGAAQGGSGSLQSVSAGASTILANSSSSLDLRDSLPATGINGNGSAGRASTRTGRSKVAPAPPAPPSLMSDHLGGAGGRSGVAWPSATIPARVKKLSWDDAADLHKDSAEAAERDSAGAPDHMNLTVYF